METLAVDGSTLPGLKDLFPEHFFEHPEQAVHLQQPATLMPQLSDAVPQLTHLQRPQNTAFQQQEMQYAMISSAAGSEFAHQLPSTRTKGNSGKHSNKRVHDVVHAQSPSHPRSQNSYYYPSEQQQFPTPSDVHLQLPGSSVQTREDTAEAEDDEDADGTPDGEKRRHSCARCGKRFNRPSSLKIHLNTHTGAKPYVCPFQGCGRTFNVSSNMRRHFRNHARRPPPPPLPQSNIYPFPPTQSSDHQELHGQWRPTQRIPDSQQQALSLSLNANYDNVTVPGDLPDYSTQFYPPSSDVRSNTTGREGQRSDNSALITPPYTNEGDERDLDNESQRNFFPPMAPYNSFGPGPGQSGSPSLLDSNRMGVQQMMTRMQSTMGVPLGTDGGVSSVFPVDPSLIGRHDGDDLNAYGDADADGELDPDLEDTDARREAEIIEDEGIRRFGPSTSNARASSNSRMELSPRRREQAIMESNGLSIPFPVAPSSSDASFSLSANNMSGVLYRQTLTPIPTDVTHVSSQASQFPQQYQSHYSQRSQEHRQQQTLTFHGTSGVNIMHGEPRYPIQMQLPNVSYTDSNQYPPCSGQSQQYAQAASLNGRNVYAAADGMRDNGTHQHAFIDGRLHSQNIDGPIRDLEYRGNSATRSLASLKTPGAAPAPPYELYSHLPLESLDGNRKTKSTRSSSSDQVDNKDANASGDEYGNDESEEEEDDDDDDDEYTGRSSPRKGKAPKRGTGNRGRGRPHVRPKSSAVASSRGRGRPRKSAPAVIEAEGQKVEEKHSNLQDGVHSTDGTEIGGRILRKRRRVSTR
ncbi:hypothetical protein ACEPAI_6607 [Sanghuangporus weigelae]